MSVHVVVLAAGQGTRMKSGVPKVLHEIAGKAMLQWVLDAAAGASPDRTIVVVGHEAEAVTAGLPKGTETVVQTEQLGTAHATALAVAALEVDDSDTVVVVPGDAPLLTADMINDLVASHGSNDATLATTVLGDPAGYGRVVRDGDKVSAVVEHGEADAEQLAIDEVATSVYAFAAAPLLEALPQVASDNELGERFLPDVIGLMVEAGRAVGAVTIDLDVVGVNSFDQLATAAETVRQRINEEWMVQGVWMLDPTRTYIDATVDLAPGARIYPGVHLEGSSTVGEGAAVGPDSHVHDSSIGTGATVRYSVLTGADVQAGASVGPYAFLRPGTVLGPDSKAGTYVELKNTTLDKGAKVPHLSYMGDATIGEDANVGAGSITCNWDGYDKHETTIGARARIGSDTMLVAPVEIGDDGWTGAGSVISKDVAEGSLAVERAPQKEIPGYAERRRKRAKGDD